MAALAQPLDYPPLASATVPGDQVVLAVEPGLRQMEAVVAGAVFSLVEAGVEPRDLSIVVASNTRPPLAHLAPSLRQELRVVLHNPADQMGLQYLAADKAARPIYLNRAICEADLVLPITTARLPESIGYVGGYSGLFPTFADLETQQRFRAPSTADHAAHQRRRQAEADQAAWLLGVHFAMQVVPAAGDDLLHVVAGRAEAVVRQSRAFSEAAWLHHLPQRSSLVVAAIDGDEDQQTWDSFARALSAAMQAAADGGVIVLLTSLACQVGPALVRLAEEHRTDVLQDELAQDRSVDAITASLLAEARDRFDVFLLSELDGDLIEGLGLGYIADAAQVERLTRKHKSAVLLGSAQYAACETRALVEP
jgi:nickel-dependent lactate racemase